MIDNRPPMIPFTELNSGERFMLRIVSIVRIQEDDHGDCQVFWDEGDDVKSAWVKEDYDWIMSR